MNQAKRIGLSALIGLALTAACYLIVLGPGDDVPAPVKILQSATVVLIAPGGLIAFVFPPTGAHSGVFDQVSFVANACLYSALAYLLLRYVPKVRSGS